MEMSDVSTHTTEVLVSHANARLTVHGRQLLVDRVLVLGRKPAHVADELGVSRQCVYRWYAASRMKGPLVWSIGPLVRIGVPVGPRPRSRRRWSRCGSRLGRGQQYIGDELGVPSLSSTRY